MKKKYRAISKFYNGVYFTIIVSSILFQLVPGIGIEGHVLFNISIVCFLIVMIGSFPTGVFSIDERGIKMYTGLKRYYHEWSEFQYVDIFRATNEVIGGETRAFTYWVYFSNLPGVYSYFRGVNPVGQAGATLDKAACFQYRKGTGKLLREVLPEHLKTQWVEIEEALEKHMNRASKLYNR